MFVAVVAPDPLKLSTFVAEPVIVRLPLRVVGPTTDKLPDIPADPVNGKSDTDPPPPLEPDKLPVIPPNTIRDQLITDTPESTMRPFLTLNSFAILFTFHFPGYI